MPEITCCTPTVPAPGDGSRGQGGGTPPRQKKKLNFWRGFRGIDQGLGGTWTATKRLLLAQVTGRHRGLINLPRCRLVQGFVFASLLSDYARPVEPC